MDIEDQMYRPFFENPKKTRPDNRGPDNRGTDNRGTDNRGPDNRGTDNRGTDNRGSTVLLNENNRTETDFADEPIFWRKSAQPAVYCTFLFKEIGPLHHFIGKSERWRANHFHGY